MEPLELPDDARIAVVRALPGVGDMLCLVPALRALRSAYPRAGISLIGLPSARPLMSRFRHYIDEFIDFPGFPGIPERPEGAPDAADWSSSIGARPFDLAIQAHGSGVASNGFVRTLGARRILAFHPPNEAPPSDGSRYVLWIESENEAARFLRLVGAIGVESAGSRLEFPLSEQDREDAARIVRGSTLRPGEYVVIHPGATEERRRWEPEAFAQVADALAAAELTVVVTGTRDERAITAMVMDEMEAPAVDLTGRTSLGGLAMLVAGARMVVCNDSGVSHIADAVGTPSVVVFRATDPMRWAPLDRESHRAVVATDAPSSGVIAVLGQIEELMITGAHHVA